MFGPRFGIAAAKGERSGSDSPTGESRRKSTLMGEGGDAGKMAGNCHLSSRVIVVVIIVVVTGGQVGRTCTGTAELVLRVNEERKNKGGERRQAVDAFLAVCGPLYD